MFLLLLLLLYCLIVLSDVIVCFYITLSDEKTLIKENRYCRLSALDLLDPVAREQFI